jgi:hypothetical protein
VPRSAIISVVEITAKLVTVMSDSGLVMVNVTPVAPSIVGKHRSRTQPQHQEHSRNRPFNIFILLRTLRILLIANPAPRLELRPFISRVCVACEPLSARVEANLTQDSNTKPAVQNNSTTAAKRSSILPGGTGEQASTLCAIVRAQNVPKSLDDQITKSPDSF